MENRWKNSGVNFKYEHGFSGDTYGDFLCIWSYNARSKHITTNQRKLVMTRAREAGRVPLIHTHMWYTYIVIRALIWKSNRDTKGRRVCARWGGNVSGNWESAAPRVINTRYTHMCNCRTVFVFPVWPLLKMVSGQVCRQTETVRC